MKTLDDFKGTKGELKMDIGFDEDRGRYSTQVYIPKHRPCIAMVYGKSIDECEANAKLFAASKKLLNACLTARGIMVLKGLEDWPEYTFLEQAINEAL